MRLLILLVVVLLLYFLCLHLSAKLSRRPSKAKRSPLTAPKAEAAHHSRVCVKGGFLVGPKVRIPEDKRYFQTPGAQFVVGCNRLQCQLCKAMIRQQVGFRDADPEAASKNVREIYDTVDFSQSSYLVADPNSQAYACQCTLVIVTGDKSFPFPNSNWGCAGHPPVDDGGVLPPITPSAANDFVVQIANSNFQQALKSVALTQRDGDSIVAMPAHMSLGEGMPKLQLWMNSVPTEVDFAKIAGACVQLTDETVTTY